MSTTTAPTTIRIWFIRFCVALDPWLLRVEDRVVLRVDVLRVGVFLDVDFRAGDLLVDDFRVVVLRVDLVTLFPRCLILVFDQCAQISNQLRGL